MKEVELCLLLLLYCLILLFFPVSNVVFYISDTLDSIGYEILYELMLKNKWNELNGLFISIYINPGVTLPDHIPVNIPGGTGNKSKQLASIQ
jgi:hypothetical protein